MRQSNSRGTRQRRSRSRGTTRATVSGAGAGARKRQRRTAAGTGQSTYGGAPLSSRFIDTGAGGGGGGAGAGGAGAGGGDDDMGVEDVDAMVAAAQLAVRQVRASAKAARKDGRGRTRRSFQMPHPSVTVPKGALAAYASGTAALLDMNHGDCERRPGSPTTNNNNNRPPAGSPSRRYMHSAQADAYGDGR